MSVSALPCFAYAFHRPLANLMRYFPAIDNINYSKLKRKVWNGGVGHFSVRVQKRAQRIGIHPRFFGKFSRKFHVRFAKFTRERLRNIGRKAQKKNDAHSVYEKFREHARVHVFRNGGLYSRYRRGRILLCES